MSSFFYTMYRYNQRSPRSPDLQDINHLGQVSWTVPTLNDCIFQEYQAPTSCRKKTGLRLECAKKGRPFEETKTESVSKRFPKRLLVHLYLEKIDCIHNLFRASNYLVAKVCAHRVDPKQLKLEQVASGMGVFLKWQRFPTYIFLWWNKTYLYRQITRRQPALVCNDNTHSLWFNHTKSEKLYECRQSHGWFGHNCQLPVADEKKLRNNQVKCKEWDRSSILFSSGVHFLYLAQVQLLAENSSNSTWQEILPKESWSFLTRNTRLPKTNSKSTWIFRPSSKETRKYPNHPFSGAMLVSGRVDLCQWNGGQLNESVGILPPNVMDFFWFGRGGW